MQRKSIRVEVDEEIHRKCKIKAAVTETTITDAIREFLRMWVEEDHPIILSESFDYPDVEPPKNRPPAPHPG